MDPNISAPIMSDSELDMNTSVVDMVIKCENEEFEEKPKGDTLVWSNAVFIKEENNYDDIMCSTENSSFHPDQKLEETDLSSFESSCNFHEPENKHQIEKETGKQNMSEYACQKCDYKCKERRSLWRHNKISHESIRYYCNLCEYKSTRKEHLNTHVSTIHLKISYLCDQCGYKASQECHLKRHKDAKHGQQQFQCEKCEYKSSIRASLSHHIRTYHQGERFKCDLCNFLSTSKSNLSKHIRAVHKQIKFKCELCDYESTTRGNVKTHADAIHRNIKYFCQYCEYESGYKAHLKKHQKIHYEIKNEIEIGGMSVIKQDSTMDNFNENVLAITTWDNQETKIE